VNVATVVAERRKKMAKSYEKGKYSESRDKKKDAAMTKGMSPAQKAKFEKMDKAHGDKKKPKTMKEDKKIDAKIIKKIKSDDKPKKAGKKS
jgi:hypothetical protein